MSKIIFSSDREQMQKEWIKWKRSFTVCCFI